MLEIVQHSWLHDKYTEACNSEYLLEGVNEFWWFPSQQDKIKNNLMLAHKVPGGMTDLENTDRQEVLISHVVELTEEELEELRVLNEPQDSDSLVEKLHMTIS